MTGSGRQNGEQDGKEEKYSIYLYGPAPYGHIIGISEGYGVPYTQFRSSRVRVRGV